MKRGEYAEGVSHSFMGFIPLFYSLQSEKNLNLTDKNADISNVQIRGQSELTCSFSCLFT